MTPLLERTLRLLRLALDLFDGGARDGLGVRRLRVPLPPERAPGSDVVRGRMAMSMDTEDGPQSDTGTWCITLRRSEDGNWRAVWDTWNSDLPSA